MDILCRSDGKTSQYPWHYKRCGTQHQGRIGWSWPWPMSEERKKRDTEEVDEIPQEASATQQPISDSSSDKATETHWEPLLGLLVQSYGSLPSHRNLANPHKVLLKQAVFLVSSPWGVGLLCYPYSSCRLTCSFILVSGSWIASASNLHQTTLVEKLLL
jgi:hypothetical protein